MSHLLSLKTTWLSSYHYKGLMCYVEYDRVNYYSLQTWIGKKTHFPKNSRGKHKRLKMFIHQSVHKHQQVLNISCWCIALLHNCKPDTWISSSCTAIMLISIILHCYTNMRNHLLSSGIHSVCCDKERVAK